MQYKAVKIHVYDKELMKIVITDISKFVRGAKDNSNSFIIQRGWVHGPHIKIICGTNHSNDLASEIKNVKDFLLLRKSGWSKRTEQKVDYTSHEKVLAKIAQLEEYEGDYLPLEPDLQIIEEDYRLEQTGMKEADILFKEEQLKTDFIVHASTYYYNLNAAEKTIFLLKIFVILGDFKSAINDNIEVPINESYLSFKSHVEGFKGQLNYHSEAMKVKVLNVLNTHNDMEKDFINHGFEKCLEASRKNFNAYDEEDKDILTYFQDTLFELDKMYIQALEGNKINFSNKHSLTNFLEDNTEHISEFHKDIMELVNMEFYDSEEFLLGRLLTNWFYSLLPLFSVSPLVKNKLCNLVCLGLEKAEQKSYIDFIHQFNRTLEGGVRK